MDNRIVAVFALLLSVFILSGCNTIKGVGKDIQAAGSGIEKAAD